jgi:hypothetical protein
LLNIIGPHCRAIFSHFFPSCLYLDLVPWRARPFALLFLSPLVFFNADLIYWQQIFFVAQQMSAEGQYSNEKIRPS